MNQHESRPASLGFATLTAAGGAGSRDALALSTLVREAVTAGVERHALHLHLSRLRDVLHQDHHHRLVREALEPVLRPVRARLFELPNGDLVAIAPAQARHMAAAEAALATLLAEEDGAGPLYTRLRLPQEAAALLAAVEDSLAPPPPLESPLGSPLAAPPETSLAMPMAGAPATGGGFSATALATLERGLGPVSLGAYLRRFPVCRLAPGSEGAELAWEEWRLDLPALLTALAPALNPAAAPWLGRRLRRLLDRRLLAELVRPEDLRELAPALLPLAVPSLTEAAFLRLDSLLGTHGRQRVIIGFEASDVLADADAFAFARDFCRGRGYRLALTEVSAATALLLPAARLGIDQVMLRWSPGLASLGPGLRAALPAAPDGVVLTGVARAAAIGWGWEEGITLFQGPLVVPRGR